MKPFNPGPGIGEQGSGSGTVRIPDPRSPIPKTALRRFRMPIPARVRVEDGRPVRVDQRGLGGRVEVAAGPWRTSGSWWEGGWDRDEWDVALADGVTYRLFHERVPADARSAKAEWFIEGIVD
jgi:protein ImuB